MFCVAEGAVLVRRYRVTVAGIDGHSLQIRFLFSLKLVFSLGTLRST